MYYYYYYYLIINVLRNAVVRSSQYGSWVFGDLIDIRVTHDRLTYTWQRPVVTSGDSEDTAIVYSLFWRSQTTSEWTQLVMV